jgi:hypothetical protein
MVRLSRYDLTVTAVGFREAAQTNLQALRRAGTAMFLFSSRSAH